MKKQILFPEYVEKEIKQRVRAASEQERRWMLEAIEDSREIENELLRRAERERMRKEMIVKLTDKFKEEDLKRMGVV